MSRNAYPHRPGTQGRRFGINQLFWLRSFVARGLTIGGIAFGAGLVQAQPPANPQATPPGVLPGVPGVPSTNANNNGKGDPTLPPPKPLNPPPGGMKPFCPPGSGIGNPGDNILGMTPRPTDKTAEKYKKYFGELIDTEVSLELISGRTRLLILRETPKRIQIADEGIAEYNLLSKDQISLMGKAVGVTVLTLWFPNPNDPTKEEILTYHVRVLPDPEYKNRLERVYKELQDQINCAFPNSVICLHVVGDKLVVTGEAHDIAECAKILQVIRSNAPMGGGLSNTGRLPLDRAKTVRDATNVAEPVGQAIMAGVEDYVIDGSSWLVNMIRIPGEQTVNLRVTIAEVNRTAARSIGLNFNLLNNNGQAYFANSTGSLLTGSQVSTFGNGFGVGGFGASAALSGQGFIPGIPGVTLGAGGYGNLLTSLDNGQVRLAINALRNVNYARLMAEPNLTALNGQTANFRAGGKFPVPVIVGTYGQGFGLQGVQYQDYGILLNFTPYITDRDRIRLVLNANISGLDVAAGRTNIGGSNIPYLNERAVNTAVEMREGQTLAVAGLIQNNVTADARRIPCVGDVPVLANIFGFSRSDAGEQELVILVTPELVHPLDCKEWQSLPGHDLFEATDFEFYVLGRIESHRNVDWRSPIRTDWSRIKTFRDMEANYIAGPCGYSQQQP